MKINITFEQFEQLYKQGVTLDMIFLLKTIEEQEETVVLEKNSKMDILYNTLYRRGFFSEEGKITLSGKELLKSILENSIVPVRKKKVVDDSFERWYAAFPPTDFFEHRGKKFTGTRSLRNSKEDCKNKLKAILNEGEYTIDELIKALEFEVLQKKEQSVKTGINKLSFMQNSKTYLHQRSYESFVELIKEGIEIKETNLLTSNGTDI